MAASTSSGTARQNRDTMSLPTSAFYPTDGKGSGLFVPTEDMWLVHEASKPSAILARTNGHTTATWEGWRKRFIRSWPDFHEWLYSVKKQPRDLEGIPSTAAMRAFRMQASNKAIAAASIRPAGDLGKRRKATEHVSERLIAEWIKQHHQLTWLNRWLLRGESAPSNIAIATQREIRGFCTAFRWRAICDRAGLTSVNTYPKWLLGPIPSIAWVKWLFGQAPPAESFVVSDKVMRLRDESTEKGICRAARCDAHSPLAWRNDEHYRKLLKTIMERVAINGRRQDFDGVTHREIGVQSRTIKSMWSFAQTGTLVARLERAGIPRSTWHSIENEAKQKGVGELLEEYLTARGHFPHIKLRKCGLTGQCFFIPSEAMLRFREAATQMIGDVTRELGLSPWSLLSKPGYDSWFEDITVSRRPYRGIKKSLPQRSERWSAGNETLSAITLAKTNGENTRSDAGLQSTSQSIARDGESVVNHIPNNPDVIALADAIKRAKASDTNRSEADIARDFCEVDDATEPASRGNRLKMAKSLLRQLRRFKHLLQ